MKEITRVTIKGSWGFCSYHEGYEDKVILTQESVSYEYTPCVETDTNPKRKWRYSTNSPVFQATFKKIAQLTEETMCSDLDGFCTDIGGIEFTLTYFDKTKLKKHYWLPADDFDCIFRIVKELVPQAESIPAVLMTADDFDEE